MKPLCTCTYINYKHTDIFIFDISLINAGHCKCWCQSVQRVAFWQYYSDLCWWSDSCLVFQGAKGPDGPAGEIGLEGKKVRTLGYTFIKSRRHNSEKKHIREQNC